MKAAQETEPLISQQEVLRHLGVSLRQLHRLMRERDDNGNPQTPLPFHWVGASRKFYLSEVRAWVRNPKKK